MERPASARRTLTGPDQCPRKGSNPMSTLPIGTDEESNARAAWIDSVRQITDWLEAHPEVPRPFHLLGEAWYIYLPSGDQAKGLLATIARAMGNAAKKVDGDKFKVARRFGAITLIA